MAESDDVIVRANGNNMLAIYIAIAETERLKLLKRQKEEIAKSKNPEKYTSRQKEYTKDQVQDAIGKYESGQYTVNQAIATTKMSSSTFYIRLREYQAKQEAWNTAE